MLYKSFKNKETTSDLKDSSDKFSRSLGKVEGVNKKLKPLLCTTLHKSRFEGDNFRKRYMSKCQSESTAEKIARLERIESSAKRFSSFLCGENISSYCFGLRNDLAVELSK